MSPIIHSASTEPPTVTDCSDCSLPAEACRCDEPSCEECAAVGSRKVKVEDCESWLCESCIAKLPPDPHAALEQIAEVLFPAGDLDHEWSVSYLEVIAEIVLAYRDGTRWTP
ncbi:MAG TPA: hypothetical protein VIG24_00320 [Acidimicrobiia bacterium]